MPISNSKVCGFRRGNSWGFSGSVRNRPISSREHALRGAIKTASANVTRQLESLTHVGLRSRIAAMSVSRFPEQSLRKRTPLPEAARMLTPLPIQFDEGMRPTISMMPPALDEEGLVRPTSQCRRARRRSARRVRWRRRSWIARPPHSFRHRSFGLGPWLEPPWPRWPARCIVLSALGLAADFRVGRRVLLACACSLYVALPREAGHCQSFSGAQGGRIGPTRAGLKEKPRSGRLLSSAKLRIGGRRLRSASKFHGSYDVVRRASGSRRSQCGGRRDESRNGPRARTKSGSTTRNTWSTCSSERAARCSTGGSAARIGAASRYRRGAPVMARSAGNLAPGDAFADVDAILLDDGIHAG